MSLVYDMICKLNPENYEHNVCVSTLDELKNDMIKYFKEYDMLEHYIDVEESNLIYEYSEVDEIEKQIDDYISSIIDWSGEGEYCIVGASYGDPKIMKIDEVLEFELDFIDFPIPLTLDLFSDTENYILKWKKSEGYKYAYLISYICHVGEPWYRATHIVYSNDKINNVINMLNNEKDIFIGEFNILGANYVVEEVEDFDINDLLRYKFSDEYETIEID